MNVASISVFEELFLPFLICCYEYLQYLVIQKTLKQLLIPRWCVILRVFLSMYEHRVALSTILVQKIYGPAQIIRSVFLYDREGLYVFLVKQADDFFYFLQISFLSISP